MRASLLGCIVTLAIAVAALDAHAQPPTQVVGRVIDADSQEPIAGVRVTISPSRPPSRLPATPTPMSFAGAVTDGDGRFAVEVTPPGRHRVIAQKQGYAFDPTEAPMVDVAAGQAATVQIALRKGGVISGRVLDDRGEPVADIRVIALRRVEGRAAPMPAMGGPGMVTNDVGEFRIASLPAGEYVLMASAQPMLPFGGGAPTSRTTWAPTYYPGTTQASEALSVTVQHADTVSGFELRLVPAAAFVVSGIAVDPAGKPVPDAVVMLRPLSEDNRPNFALTASGPTKPDGTFSISGVIAGRYTIAVTPIVRSTNGITSFTSLSMSAPPQPQTTIDVDGANVVGVRVVVPRPPQQ
jgi:hypothetical protein